MKILELLLTGGCGYGGTGAPPSTMNRYSFVGILVAIFRVIEVTARDTDNNKAAV